MITEQLIKELSSIQRRIHTCKDLNDLNQIREDLNNLKLEDQNNECTKRFTTAAALLETKSETLQKVHYTDESLDSLRAKLQELEAIKKQIPLNTTNALELELPNFILNVNTHISAIDNTDNILELADPQMLIDRTNILLNDVTTKITRYHASVQHRKRRCEDLDKDYELIAKKILHIIENQEVSPSLFQQAADSKMLLERLRLDNQLQLISLDSYINYAGPEVKKFTRIYNEFLEVIKRKLRKEEADSFLEKIQYTALKVQIETLPSEAHLFQAKVTALRQRVGFLDGLITAYIEGNGDTLTQFEEKISNQLHELQLLITPEDDVKKVMILYASISNEVQNLTQKQQTEELTGKATDLKTLYTSYNLDRVHIVEFTQALLQACQLFETWLHLEILKFHVSDLENNLASIPETHRTWFYYEELIRQKEAALIIYQDCQKGEKNFETSLQAMMPLKEAFAGLYREYEQFAEKVKQYEDYRANPAVKMEYESDDEFIADLFNDRLNPEFLFEDLKQSLNKLHQLCEQHKTNNLTLNPFLSDFATTEAEYLLSQQMIATHHANIVHHKTMAQKTNSTLENKADLHPRLQTELTTTVIAAEDLIKNFAAKECEFNDYKEQFEAADVRHSRAIQEFEAFYPLYQKYGPLKKWIGNLPPTQNEKDRKQTETLQNFLQALTKANNQYGIQEGIAPPPINPENILPELPINFEAYAKEYNFYTGSMDSILQLRKDAIALEMKFLETQIQTLRDHPLEAEYAKQITQTATQAMFDQVDAFKELDISKDILKKNLRKIVKDAIEGPLKLPRGWKNFILNTTLFIGTFGIGYTIGMFIFQRPNVIETDTASVSLARGIEQTVQSF